MQVENLDKLRYPIGRFDWYNLSFSKEDTVQNIQIIADFANKIKAAVSNLDDEQLNTPYRPQGWTVRQVVHHCADSHSNALTRFKLALTEDTPTIKPYLEAKWAELLDGKTMPIQPSLSILEGVHAPIRCFITFNFRRRFGTFIHPSRTWTCD